jgi:hypothetical protein
MFNRLSIVVPYRYADAHRQDLHDWTLSYIRASFPGAEVILGEDKVDGPFSRAAAINDGARQSNRELLLITDGDLVYLSGNVVAGMQLLDAGAAWVIPYNRYRGLTREATAILLTRPPAGPWVIRADWTAGGNDGWSVGGVTLISRTAFESMSGFDKRFRGWGCEDWAFRYSAETLLGPLKRAEGTIWHLWHPSAMHQATASCPESVRANSSLLARYLAAKVNPDLMKKLVAEHAG